MIDGDIAHAELIIPAGRAGPLLQLLGAGSVPPAPGPRDTTQIESADLLQVIMDAVDQLDISDWSFEREWAERLVRSLDRAGYDIVKRPQP